MELSAHSRAQDSTPRRFTSPLCPTHSATLATSPPSGLIAPPPPLTRTLSAGPAARGLYPPPSPFILPDGRPDSDLWLWPARLKTHPHNVPIGFPRLTGWGLQLLPALTPEALQAPEEPGRVTPHLSAQGDHHTSPHPEKWACIAPPPEGPRGVSLDACAPGSSRPHTVACGDTDSA